MSRKIKDMKTRFNKTIAKDIAERSFCLVLDCIMGYSDSSYDLDCEAESFEQNFEEDLEEMNVTITDKRIKIISEYYEKMRFDLVTKIRKKYYD